MQDDVQLEQRAPGEALEGMDSLRRLEQAGARFCKVTAWNAPGSSPGKRPLEPGWQGRPLTAGQVAPHLRRGGNVGMLCGRHSGGLCLLDIDEGFGEFTRFFPAFAAAPAILRGGADRGKLLLQLTGRLPAPRKWRGSPGETHPALELLSTGNQGVAAGLHPSGEPYRLVNPAAPLPRLRREDLGELWEIWTGEAWEEHEAAEGESPRAAPPAGGSGWLRETVAGYWNPLRVFEHFGRVTETRTEARGQWLRLLGNGGLFVHLANGRPDGGWSMPGQPEVGGGPFEAWMYAKTGSCRAPEGRAFHDLLVEMAQAGGLPLSPPAPAPPDPRQSPQPEGRRPARRVPDDGELAARYRAANPLLAHSFGEWKRYGGAGVWVAARDEVIELEILRMLEEARAEGVRVSRSLLSSVTELARLAAAVPEERWDADPDRVVCRNGTLHIPTRTLREHRPEDYCTAGLAFDYDPQAEAPYWEYFLESAAAGTADFLQEFAGYALTSDTRHELAVWLVGPAGSGKSTFLEGLQVLLGERATLLGLAEVERSRFALGDLRGKTLALASEQPAGYMQAVHLLNAIISGEKIHIERKFQDPVEFNPVLKVIWAMNELPRVPDAASGLFRRVKVVRFPALATERRDPDLKELIGMEGSGILNWALAGLERLRARGRFEPPEGVTCATAEFVEKNDLAGLFVHEACQVGAERKVRAGLLYQAYKDWCARNGHRPLSSTSLAQEWNRMGFEKNILNGRNFWQGLELNEPGE
jgi:P4 family phage/plasmid primase-like protien